MCVCVDSAVRATNGISSAPGILQCDVGATDDVVFNAASVFYRGLSFALLSVTIECVGFCRRCAARSQCLRCPYICP